MQNRNYNSLSEGFGVLIMLTAWPGPANTELINTTIS